MVCLLAHVPSSPDLTSNLKVVVLKQQLAASNESAVSAEAVDAAYERGLAEGKAQASAASGMFTAESVKDVMRTVRLNGWWKDS